MEEKMPKISLSTWSLSVKMNCHSAIQFAVANGFEGIEIWSNALDFWPRTVTAKEIENIRSIALENRLSLAVHFCTINNNLADLNGGHLNESMNQLKETIRLCRRIGGQLVIIHPGTYSDIIALCDGYTNPGFAPAILKQVALDRFKKCLQEAALFAESHDVIVGLENRSSRPECIQSTVEDLAEWVDQINSPSLKISLDIGRANLEGGAKNIINVLGDRIRHVQLYDNDVTGTDHRELGTGTIDWKSIAPFLKSFRGMLSLKVMECKDVEGAILRSKSFLNELLASSRAAAA
jgi:sugar phosphate isomerase/epimerase